MKREDLTRKLLEIDEEAWLAIGVRAPKARVVIVGGAAFMLRGLTPRKITHDIDVYEVDELVEEILAMYPEINGGVMAYSDQIPYNFEDRLRALDLKTKTIEFVTPSIEDLIVMKLYAERPHDIQDIDGAVESDMVDWEVLEYLVYDPGEAMASALSMRRYQEMVEAFERMKERYGR